MGFWSASEIVAQAMERGDGDNATITNAVDDEWRKRQAEVALLPSPGCYQRLANLFDELNNERLISLHCAGYTNGDGMSAIDEVIAQVPYKLVGYIYYHQQDLERCIDSQQLTLSYGAFRETEQTASSGRTKTEMGAYLSDKLRAAGFEVQWDGLPTTKLTLVNFTWDRMPEKSAWCTERCIERLQPE
jgi:hypothetical protein